MVENVFIKGLYNFDIWNTLNPTQIKLEQDKLLKIIKNYNNKDFIYRFLVEGLTFRRGITSDASFLFITCNGLSKAPFQG